MGKHVKHVTNIICHKVNKTLSPLYPIAKHIPRPILDQIYKTYARPHFDYADIIYDGHITVQDANRLETLQKQGRTTHNRGTLHTSGSRGGPPRPWPPPNANLARPDYVLASPKPASGFT